MTFNASIIEMQDAPGDCVAKIILRRERSLNFILLCRDLKEVQNSSVAKIAIRVLSQPHALPSDLNSLHIKHNSSPFKWRHFEPELILLCVRRCCRNQLSWKRSYRLC
jgi:hypothetical protein